MIKGLTVKISYAELTGFILAVLVFLCSFHNRVINGYIPFLSSLQNYMSVLLLLVLILMNVVLRDRIQIKNTTLLLCGLIGVIFLSSIIYKRNINATIINLFPMLMICLSLDLTNHNRKSLLAYIDVLKYMLMLVVLVDIATQIAYPNGMYSTLLYDINWFLGYKTERTIYSIPMIMLFYYSSYEKKEHLDAVSYFALILGIVNAILSQGSGCSIILLILGFFTIILSLGKGGKLYRLIVRCLDCRLVVIIFFAAFFFLVLVEQSAIMTYVAELFGKSPNLSGRTKIWSACLGIFTDSPIIGNGYLRTNEYVLLARFRQATNAHNSIISLLVSGGVVSLILYFVIYFYTLTRKRKFTTKEMLMTIFVYIILMLGLTSSIYIFSPFSFLPFWLMEREKKRNGFEISSLLPKKRKGRKKLRCIR